MTGDVKAFEGDGGRRRAWRPELLTLHGAGHGFKGKDAEVAEKAMFAFFDKHLTRRSRKRVAEKF